MSDSLGKLTASLGLDTSSLSSGIASAKASLGSLAGPVGIAVGAAVGLGAALFAVGEKFKGAYSTIQVGTGATGAALKGLEGSFKDVLAGTAGSFDQVAAAITGVSQRTGLTGAALDDFAKKEVTLGRITKTDVGENVQATTALFALYGIAASEQSAKLDVLFKASQIAGVSVGELTSQVQAATPVAKALGLTFDQTAALTANLTQAGLPASKVMQGLGKEFTAAAKAGKDPLSVIKDIEEQIKKAPNDTAAAEIAFQKFGVRAGPQLAAALREGRFDLTQTLTTITDGKGGILATGAAISTIGAKFQHLKNEALVALEPIGTGLYNLANKALGGLIREIDVLAPKVTAAFAVVKSVVAKAWDDLVGGFQNPSARIGASVGTVEATFLRIGQVVRKAFDDIKVTVATLQTALRPVFDFIEAHAKPILIGLGVAVAALTAPFTTLAVGLVYAYSRFQAFHDAVDAVVKFLRDDVAPAVVAFAGYLRDQFGHLVDYITTIWPQVSEAIGHVMVVIQDIVAVALAVLREAWQEWGGTVLTVVKAAWDQIKTVVSEAIRVIRDVIQVVLAIINGDWGKAWDALKDIAAAVFDVIKTFVRTDLDIIKGVFDGVMNSIKALWDAAWGAVRDTAKSALKAVVDFFLQAAIDILGAAEKAFGWVPGLGGKLREAHDRLVDFKNDVNATLSDIAKDPINVTVYAHLDDSQVRSSLAALQADAVANPPDQFDTSTRATGGLIPRMAFGGLRRAAAGLGRLGAGGGHPHGPTLVSEAGVDEWVITPDPLYRVQNLGYLSQANQALGSPLGQGGGATQVTVTPGTVVVQLDGKTIATATVRYDAEAQHQLTRSLR